MRAEPYPETLDRAARRALGCYYTPERIVRHVVRAVLGPLESLAAPLRRQNRLATGPALRILDPAMGDGAFLVEAAEFLATRLGGRPRLAPEARRTILSPWLAGVDIDPQAVRLARAALGCESGAPELVCADALAERPPFAGKFHAIIGNPPWGGWDRSLDAATRRHYRERFATARGRLDPFALFIERATGMLREDGRLGFVLPDIFLLKNYPAVRRHVLENYAIEELIHWGRAFPGVNLDVCTLVARKGGGGARAVRCLPDGPQGRVNHTPQSRFARSPGYCFNLSLDRRGASLLGRLEREGVRLGDWTEAHEGIHSGNVRERLFRRPSGQAKEETSAVWRPLVLGRGEIRPFHLAPEGWTVRYDRRCIRRSLGEYASLGREGWFTAPKILVRRTGDRVVAALDREGLFASNNLFVVLARPGCPVPLDFIEGYLNSSLATWSFRAIQPRKGRLFAELKLVHLNRLPVPRPRSGEEIGRIVRIVRRLRGRNGRPSAAGRRLLDDLFGEMAGLSQAEGRLVSRERDLSPGAKSL